MTSSAVALNEKKAAVSRRALLGAASLGGASLCASALTRGPASACAQGEDAYTYADTVAWQAEYDVVVVGMGFAGMVSAMSAADAGASVLLVEKMPEGEAGGNSRVCGQMFAYGNDDPEATYQYFSALRGGREVPDDMLRTYTDRVAVLAGTIADMFELDREEFCDWSQVPPLNVMSPEYPELPGADKMGLWAVHKGMSDSFLYQTVKGRLVEKYADKVDVWFASPATALIQDPQSKTVLGVAVDRQGESRNVRALNGVCLCTGGFEDDKEMVQTYLNVVNYAPIGALHNTGDGVRMAQEVGAKMWHMTAYEGGMGMCGLGYYTPEGVSAAMLSPLVPTLVNTGATVVVGDRGRRFANEAGTVRHGHMDDGNGLWENPVYPEYIYVVWDETQYGTIVEASALKPDWADTVVACASLAEAAEVIGCDPETLQETIDDFNFYAGAGKDYECGRAPETMRAFEGASLYVMPARNLLLNTQGGPQRDAQAQVLDTNGDPIPHLYSAGELGGITAFMYQGGSNVAECIIFGQIAGVNAAAPKDALPPYAARDAVASTPAHLGDETDLARPLTADELAASAPEGALVGVGDGIGGPVPVTVALDESGAVASVEVGDNSETEGIGSKAIEQMPERFVGLSSAEQIDAVDGVSGATITSKALRAAVKDALGL